MSAPTIFTSILPRSLAATMASVGVLLLGPERCPGVVNPLRDCWDPELGRGAGACT